MLTLEKIKMFSVKKQVKDIVGTRKILRKQLINFLLEIVLNIIKLIMH